jgi:conjugal transfer pilus assembly protein TrbC
VLLTALCAQEVFAQAGAPVGSDVPAMPSAPELDARMRSMQGSMPQLKALAPPPPDATIDLGALAARAERLQTPSQGHGAATDRASGLLVFVSLTMPPETLDRLVDQAQRFHAHLVLRGLKDRSLKATAIAVRRILRDRPVAWLIDPRAFERFGITAVPTFVLVDPSRPIPTGCDAARCQPAVFSKLAGDVSTDYALREMAASDPDVAGAAAALLARAR